ncbi:MAG TPA: ABC transporter ATP-binding protein [Bryobacteraceae bacterium]|nr:ABC transporter ATP-binding protein [Bryobacteraceae bacterium]
MGLELDRVTKRFGGREVVSRVSLTGEDGEFVVLLGPSGCGKTTLLRMIAGLEAPDEGAIRLGGADITAKDARDRDLAMVFQSYALYPHMTVARNIGYPLRVRKHNAAEIARRVEDVAARLGLRKLLENFPRQLSGGERQRVALARAIVRRPRAFLMDEPLSNLDARLRVEMRAELKHLQHELAVVTVYVTHDQAEAMTLAHRIAVMRDGKIQQYDTPSNVYHRPANTFVAGFVGSPAMNLIEQGNRTLGVRPEDVELASFEQPGYTPARVWVTEEMGNETVVVLSAGDRQITARAPSGFRADFDSPAWFRFRAGREHWFDSSGQRIADPA